MDRHWKIDPPFIGLYYIPDNLERKAIHRYLEANHPDVHKTSFSHSSRSNQSECILYCPKCHCENTVVLFEDGRYRSWRSCDGDCREEFKFKPSYDDFMMGLYSVRGNVIAFGDFFKSYNNAPSSDEIPLEEDIYAILATKPLILLSLGDEFEKLRGKRQSTIAEWIDWKMKRKAYIVQEKCLFDRV